MTSLLPSRQPRHIPHDEVFWVIPYIIFWPWVCRQCPRMVCCDSFAVALLICFCFKARLISMSLNGFQQHAWRWLVSSDLFFPVPAFRTTSYSVEGDGANGLVWLVQEVVPLLHWGMSVLTANLLSTNLLSIDFKKLNFRLHKEGHTFSIDFVGHM